jgi:hypothetical protein
VDQRLNSYTPLKSTDRTKFFLNDFFKVIPSDGKENLAQYILECKDDAKLRQLVESIRIGLLIPMKAQGGKTPSPITPSPRSDLEDSIENLKNQNVEPITRSPQSQLRRHCLERDGNKCLATGAYSHTHDHPRNAPTTHLEAAYIIPFALGSFQANTEDDKHLHVWNNLTKYFPVLNRMSFERKHLNSEKNILMLDMQLSREFGQFRLIFEETGLAHQYRIKTFRDTATVPIQNLPRNCLVKFRVHKGQWDLPDPQLLKIHACIGKFLHMSGQAEAIDKVLDDFEYCGGLAPSGNTNLQDLLAASSLSLLTSY